MKNCFDCKFAKTLRVGLLSYKELKEYQPNEHILLEENNNLSGDLVGKCLQGHNERMRDFRKEHGNKTRSVIEGDRSLDMDCHDDHESTKMLQSMIDKTDQLLELLGKENEKKDDKGK